MSKRADVAPIWTSPAPGARRPKLTREQIAAVALAIADGEGFEAVSMRRIATELEVGTMTLYYYVRTKADLLALMDDALMAEILLPEPLPTDWRVGMAAIARQGRGVFMRHPWALQSLQGAALGPNGLRHMEQTLAIMATAAFDAQTKMSIVTIVDDYMFGNVLRSQDMWPAAEKTARTINEFTSGQLRTGDYPRLAEMLGTDEPLAGFAKIASWIDDDARFECGLAALLDGLTRWAATRPAPKKARRRRP